jgi:hypothetical protein
MVEEEPRRRRGRPNKEPQSDAPLDLRLPKHHWDYLQFLAKKRRLGISAKQVAEHILIRELDAMFQSGYHTKEVPSD